jgi:hypothetical protein
VITILKSPDLIVSCRNGGKPSISGEEKFFHLPADNIYMKVSAFPEKKY